MYKGILFTVVSSPHFSFLLICSDKGDVVPLLGEQLRAKVDISAKIQKLLKTTKELWVAKSKAAKSLS